MTGKSLNFFICFLGMLLLPGMSGWAQRNSDEPKKVNFEAIVWAEAEKKPGQMGRAFIPFQDIQVRLTFSDGQSVSSVSSDQGLAVFKGLPAGVEYMAEVSAEGYLTTVYHGTIPLKPGFPKELTAIKDPSGSAKGPSPFKDAGRADIEGFVTCPTESVGYVFEPLPDAFVLYTSSADSVYTSTDQHGYFRFDGIKDRNGKVSVSHITCKSTEAATPPKDGSRWLWLTLEQDPFKLAAAKVTDSMPVISIVGDTVRYNVAATQKLMHGDRLGDVLERLPGMTVENGMVMVLGKPLSEILVNGSDLFGRSQSDALSYLAGLQINKIDVFEKDDERNPGSGRRRMVMNVKTKRFLRNVTDIDVSLSGGGNMPLSKASLMPPERWQAGAGARYFSVPLTTTVDLGANNLGIESGLDLSRLPETSFTFSNLVKPAFATVKVQKALKLNDNKTRAIETLGFNYSFKKRDSSNEKETWRSYDPDDDWISREYESMQRSRESSLTHRGELSWNSNGFSPQKSWYPHASLAFSHNASSRQSDFRSNDVTRSADAGIKEITLHQLSELKSRNYTVSGSAGAYHDLKPGLHVDFNLTFNGGEGDGSEIRSDSTSTQNTWIISDEGKNAHLSAHAGLSRHLTDQRFFSCKYDFNYDHGLQRKLKYDEVVDDAHLSAFTSEDSRSNIYRHTLSASYDLSKVMFTAGVQASHVLDARELPYQEHVDRVFAAPFASVRWNPLGVNMYKRFTLTLSTQSTAPSLNQLGSVFHDNNPHAVTRGNPDLKQTHTLQLRADGADIIYGRTLNYNTSFSYNINEVVPTRTYYAEETLIDGYTLPAGATFSTYANATGSMRWSSSAHYSASIKAIRYLLDISPSYTFSRTSSFINERFEHYTSHRPSLAIAAKSNFSSRYKLNFSANGSINMTDSPYYGPSRYSTLSTSVNSDNRITEWLFVRATYRHSTRFPMGGKAPRVDTDMLNASTGVYLLDSRLCIALIFRDILNNMPSLTTTAYSNYLETVRTTNLNRYMLLSIRYNFNSSEKY